MFPIEKDIPHRPRAGRRFTRYPFAEMQPGDSIFVPFAVSPYPNVSAAAHAHGRLHGKRFAVSCLKAEGGTRVWRLADKKPGDPFTS